MTNINKPIAHIETGDPLEEVEQLFEDGELQRLIIYGDEDYLGEIMQRLADACDEGLHSMDLQSHCKVLPRAF